MSKVGSRGGKNIKRGVGHIEGEGGGVLIDWGLKPARYDCDPRGSSLKLLHKSLEVS